MKSWKPYTHHVRMRRAFSDTPNGSGDLDSGWWLWTSRDTAGRSPRGAHSHGARLGKFFFEFCFLKRRTLVYIILLSDGRAPKRRGHGKNFPSSSPLLDGPADDRGWWRVQRCMHRRLRVLMAMMMRMMLMMIWRRYLAAVLQTVICSEAMCSCQSTTMTSVGCSRSRPRTSSEPQARRCHSSSKGHRYHHHYHNIPNTYTLCIKKYLPRPNYDFWISQGSVATVFR